MKAQEWILWINRQCESNIGLKNEWSSLQNIKAIGLRHMSYVFIHYVVLVVYFFIFLLNCSLLLVFILLSLIPFLLVHVVVLKSCGMNVIIMHLTLAFDIRLSL